MSKDILYFMLLIAPLIPAFVVLIHDTDLPKEKEERRDPKIEQGIAEP